MTINKQELSPVEKHGPLWFKREDLAGGQKGRQLKFMVEDYLATCPPPHGLLSAAPGTSPQAFFAAREAYAYDLPCIVVVGVNTMEAALAFPPVKIAETLGCDVVIAGASQNNWRRDRKYKALCGLYPTYFQVPEGLGPCKDDPAWLERFYLNSAIQVMNLPEDIKTLVVPTGSGNSCVSILLGLATYKFSLLEGLNIVLAVLGTGADGKMRKTVDAHIRRGLSSSKLALLLYEEAEHIPIYPKSEYGTPCKTPLEFYGIRLHPNYENKIAKVLLGSHSELLVEGTCLWIVGSEPRLEDFVEAR